MAKVVRGTRITGAQRETLAAQYAKKYESGQSIRKIAETAGRSFGFVHGVLVEHGVTLRGRGGATRGAKRAASGAVKKASPAAATKTAAKKTAAKSAPAAAKAVGKTTTAKAPATKTTKAAAKQAPAAKVTAAKTPAAKAPAAKATAKKATTAKAAPAKKTAAKKSSTKKAASAPVIAAAAPAKKSPTKKTASREERRPPRRRRPRRRPPPRRRRRRPARRPRRRRAERPSVDLARVTAVDRTALPGGVEVIFDRDRGLAEVWLNRPEVRNAQTMATWASLARAAEIIGEESDLSVVVLRGTGDDFSAGLDLRMLRGTAPAGEGDLRQLLIKGDAEVTRAIAVFQRGFSCWRELPVIVVAVVTGHAIGAGFQLALAADLRILTDDAVLVMAEARLGLVPDLGGTGKLARDRGLCPRPGDLCHRPAGRRGQSREAGVGQCRDRTGGPGDGRGALPGHASSRRSTGLPLHQGPDGERGVVHPDRAAGGRAERSAAVAAQAQRVQRVITQEMVTGRGQVNRAASARTASAGE